MLVFWSHNSIAIKTDKDNAGTRISLGTAGSLNMSVSYIIKLLQCLTINGKDKML